MPNKEVRPIMIIHSTFVFNFNPILTRLRVVEKITKLKTKDSAFVKI